EGGGRGPGARPPRLPDRGRARKPLRGIPGRRTERSRAPACRKGAGDAGLAHGAGIVVVGYGPVPRRTSARRADGPREDGGEVTARDRGLLGLVTAFIFIASAAPAATLIKAAHLLDPRTGNVLSPVAVLIEGDRIKEVGPLAKVQADAPPGVETIDLGAATLLPGLIDSHTHLLIDPVIPPDEEVHRR